MEHHCIPPLTATVCPPGSNPMLNATSYDVVSDQQQVIYESVCNRTIALIKMKYIPGPWELGVGGRGEGVEYVILHCSEIMKQAWPSTSCQVSWFLQRRLLQF